MNRRKHGRFGLDVVIRAVERARAHRRPGIATTIVVLVVGAVLLVHARDYLPFFADDGFISLRYAQRWIEGHGLTWNDGERVEGYSNFLWVLGCAVLGWLGLDLVVAARWLGGGSGVLAMAGLIAVYRRGAPGFRDMVPAMMGSLFLALAGPMAVWSVGGLEQPLVAACLSWGLFLVFRRMEDQSDGDRRAWLLAGLPLALLCWARPDGALVAVSVAAGLALSRRSRAWLFGKIPWLLALPVAFVLIQLAFRLSYYGAWIPNSGSAKLAFTPERLAEGWRYVLGSIVPFKALIVIAATCLFPMVMDGAARRRLLVLLTTGLTWLLYIVVVGGDIFPARRHLLIPVLLLCFATAEGFRWLMDRGPRLRYWTTVGAIAGLTLFFTDQVFDPENQRARHERWEWEGKSVGLFLGRHFAPSGARLATDSAGALPYFSRLETIDMLGINDRTLATNRPKDFGRGALGHELGNGDYVLSREPDLVLFGLPRGERHALYRSGREMQGNPLFASDYALIRFEADGPPTIATQVWVRRESRRLGFQKEPSRIVVPGFSMAVGHAIAKEDEEGRLGAITANFAPAATRSGAFTPGRWRGSPAYSGLPLDMSVQWAGSEPKVGESPFEFDVPDPAPASIDIAVRPRGAGLSHVREIVLTRVD